MNLIVIIRIAWEGLLRNKLRSLLTMLGVIIGVAAVIVMISVSAGTEASIAANIETLGTNLLFVSPNLSGFNMRGGGPSAGNQVMLTFDDMDAIKTQVKGISGGNISIDGVTVVGTTPDYSQVRDVPVAEGRFITQKDMDQTAKVAVLGYSIAQDLFGDANPVGQKITINNVKLTIVGVTAAKGYVGNTDYDSRLYVPITLIFERLANNQFARFQGDMVSTIIVQVEDLKDMDKVSQQLLLVLAKRKEVSLEDLPFGVRTQQDIIATQESTTASFRSLLAWVASVSLLVGGIGIMNIMLVSVTERRREIGIRQAVGATPNDIRGQFLTEALLLSLVGGMLGVLCGIAGGWLFGRLGSMPTVIVPSSILLAFASAAVVGIFFGYYPANRAAILDPIEALRHE
jgi:putative ABC transport system permease protein